MKCAQCGTDNLAGACFCHRCGRPLPSAAALLPAGAVLQGRYQIGRLLGRGGMGAVYLAHHLALGEAVAVKEMHDDALDPAERAQAVAQFQAEARTLARLRHPNLPRVWDHFNENGRWYLVMDYVEGQTLAEVQAAAGGGPLPEPTVLSWADQLCDVLHYLHGQSPPLVFRDLKPANVIADGQGQVKLIDFGIARFFHPAKSSDTLKMGSEGYAPPEQYGGQGQTTPRSDVYALGATLHHLLTGADPATQPFCFSPVATLNPRVSRATGEAVARAVALEPAGRFATAAEMRAALLPGGRPASPWPRVMAVLASAAAVALLLLAAVLVYKALDKGGAPTAQARSSATDAPPAGPTLGSHALTTAAGSRSPTATPRPGAAASPTPARTLGPTSTAISVTSPEPQPTATFTRSPGGHWPPPASATPTRRPSATPPPVRPPAAPILGSPEAGKELQGTWHFEWTWPHAALPPGQGFDLLIWSQAEHDVHQGRDAMGVIAPSRQISATVDLDSVATIVEQGEGTYYWTAIVVNLQPYQRIGDWGERWAFVYKRSSSSGGSGGSGGVVPLSDPCAGFDCMKRCCSGNSDPLCGRCCPGFCCP